jgi:hypothetical protein
MAKFKTKYFVHPDKTLSINMWRQIGKNKFEYYSESDNKWIKSANKNEQTLIQKGCKVLE